MGWVGVRCLQKLSVLKTLRTAAAHQRTWTTCQGHAPAQWTAVGHWVIWKTKKKKSSLKAIYHPNRHIVLNTNIQPKGLFKWQKYEKERECGMKGGRERKKERRDKKKANKRKKKEKKWRKGKEREKKEVRMEGKRGKKRKTEIKNKGERERETERERQQAKGTKTLLSLVQTMSPEYAKWNLLHLRMWMNFSSSFNSALLPPLWKCSAGNVVPSFRMKIMYAHPWLGALRLKLFKSRRSKLMLYFRRASILAFIDTAK